MYTLNEKTPIFSLYHQSSDASVCVLLSENLF